MALLILDFKSLKILDSDCNSGQKFGFQISDSGFRFHEFHAEFKSFRIPDSDSNKLESKFQWFDSGLVNLESGSKTLDSGLRFPIVLESGFRIILVTAALRSQSLNNY